MHASLVPQDRIHKSTLSGWKRPAPRCGGMHAWRGRTSCIVHRVAGSTLSIWRSSAQSAAEPPARAMLSMTRATCCGLRERRMMSRPSSVLWWWNGRTPVMSTHTRTPSDHTSAFMPQYPSSLQSTTHSLVAILHSTVFQGSFTPGLSTGARDSTHISNLVRFPLDRWVMVSNTACSYASLYAGRE